MSWNNKVVWTEGMFLRPHHFQQQVRYLENYVEHRCGPLRSYPWGFAELRLDHQMLTLGKLSVTSARGVFPDGTPFNVPEDDEPPLTLDVPENLHEVTAYLGLPIRHTGTVEFDSSDDPHSVARYLPREYEVRDSNAGTDKSAWVQVGKLRLRLLLETDKRDEYACMPVAHIVESRVDKNVLLEEQFLPPLLDCHGAALLGGFIKELQGLLHHRGEALAGRISESGRGGAAEIADFLLLQAVNRYEPLIAHLAGDVVLHPADFYELAVQLSGEIATFTSKTKRPEVFPPYRHEDLMGTYAPVMAALRQSLSMVLEQTAISIPLQERKYGIRVAPITDRGLLSQAVFVLAVNASIPTEELRKRFPTQVKIGPVEQIRQLVNLQLPGIRVRPLPVAPRQIPYHAGFVYFELDRASEYWKQLDNSGGFALHIGGDFPGLEMEFWAIKG